MIKLEVEDYCHDCRDFEADTYYHCPEINSISIFCEHRNKCRAIKKYLDKQNEAAKNEKT